MAPQSSHQDLAQAMIGLQKSLYILLVHYKFYLKSLILILLVYLFYRLGNISVKDQILSKKQQLSRMIQKRLSIRVQIPKRIQKLQKINQIVLCIAALLLVCFGTAYYIKYKPIRKNSGMILTLIIGSVVVILSVLNIYKYFLNKKFRQNDSLQRVITKHLSEFSTSLGPKVNKLLKNHLCKQKISKIHTSIYSNQCQKPDCKQLRTLLKSRAQAVQSLTNQVINFEWCSLCKKQPEHDEYLGFQYRQYEKRGQTQEEQIQYKMNYLLQGIQKMRRWLSVTSPCNCSKIYWTVSTEKIIEYKKVIKNAQSRIKQSQHYH